MGVNNDMDIRAISLCSGAGGLELGVRLVAPLRVVCYVEKDPYCQELIIQRFRDGALEAAPIWDDLKTFDGRPWHGAVDCIMGGFPCQPHSVAGKRLGEADERDLWPDVARIIGEVRPGVVFLENVPGIMEYYHRRIRPELRAMGYAVAEGIFSAAEVGAPHQRQRLFIMAHACGTRRRAGQQPQRERSQTPYLGTVADAERQRGEGGALHGGNEPQAFPGGPASTLSPSSAAMAYADGHGAGERYDRNAIASKPGQVRQRRDSENQTDTGTNTDDSGKPLAHAGRAERGQDTTPGHIAHGHDAGRTEAAGGAGERSGAVGKSQRSRRQAPRIGRDIDAGPEPQTGSRGMGDANIAGLEGHGGEHELREGTTKEKAGGRCNDVPTWPPSPTDTDAWAAVLDRWPELAPATAQSPVRGVANVVAHRLERLRTLGNGVVPAVAAKAWETLMEELS